jgi:hypothetical protein
MKAKHPGSHTGALFTTMKTLTKSELSNTRKHPFDFDLNNHQDFEELKKIYIQAIVETHKFTESETSQFENYYLKGLNPALAVQIILLDRKSNREGQR